jgi:hypothetical protein
VRPTRSPVVTAPARGGGMSDDDIPFYEGDARADPAHSDWHVGKVLKGQSRLDEQIARAGPADRGREERTARPDRRRRRPVRHRQPEPRRHAIVTRALSALRRPAPTSSRSAATTTTARRWTRCGRGPRRPASRCAAR